MKTPLAKAELVATVADGVGLPRAVAAAAINLFLETLGSHVYSGGKVTLVGFGTFRVSNRKARTGRNPKTGAEVKIPPKAVMLFKASKKGIERGTQIAKKAATTAKARKK